MKSLFKKGIRTEKSVRPYLMVKLWWIKKMNGLTCDLSKLQLLISLFVFTILGTLLCLYIAVSGFLNHKSGSIHIDAVTTVRSADKVHKSKAPSIINTQKK